VRGLTELRRTGVGGQRSVGIAKSITTRYCRGNPVQRFQLRLVQVPWRRWLNQLP